MNHPSAATRGYTLIELLVVIALMALAAALAVPRLTTQHYSPGQFAEGLSSYLNAASASADNRSNAVCIEQSGQEIVMDPPIEKPLKIPKDLEVTLPRVCFETTGMPQVPVEASVQHRSGSGPTIFVKSEGIYGKVKVTQ